MKPLFLLLGLCAAYLPVNSFAQSDSLEWKLDSVSQAQLFFMSPSDKLLYYQHADKTQQTGFISAGGTKYPLKEANLDLGGFTFKYLDTVRTVDDYIRETNAVGIILIKNGKILYERYSDGTNANTKWIDFSVAKSVTSLLFGAAIQDGFINSLDEKVSTFIPELKGSEYDHVSLFNLLQMSSGVAWNDDPRDQESDLMKIARVGAQGGLAAAFEYLSKLKRAAPAGEKFNYNTIETTLASIILRNAVGKPLSQYLSERIWRPFGMHADANWVRLRNRDTENGGCCISATLRDHALLGIFALRNGVALNGNKLLPDDWMKRSIAPSKGSKGYGMYWWLRPNGRYFASGSFGQQIEVDPSQDAVVAILSYWPTAFNKYYIGYLDTFIDALLEKSRLDN